MRWYEKFLVVPVILATGWSFGWSSTIIYAHHHIIPGVDRPFDPANYWSLDSISVPDSKPSTYTLRDLASSGGQVYDHQRHLKSIESTMNFINQLKNLLLQVGLMRDESTMFSAGTTSQMQKDLEDISDAIYSGTTKVAYSDDANSPYYHAPSEDGKLGIRPSDTTQYLKQSAYNNSKMSQAVDYMNQSEENQQTILEALNRAVNASNSAVSRNQILQSKNQIRALKTLTKNQSAEMLAEVAKLEALEEEQKADVERSNDAAWDGKFGFHIFDASDPLQKKLIDGYYRFTGEKPYESKPMPDFE